MTELVETEEEYVKKLGHVCEVSYQALLMPIVTAAHIGRITLERWRC